MAGGQHRRRTLRARRLHGRRRHAAAREQHDVQRPLDRHAFGNVDDANVRKARLVERGEAVHAQQRIHGGRCVRTALGQRALQRRQRAVERGAARRVQTADRDALWKCREVAQGLAAHAVDEHKPHSGAVRVAANSKCGRRRRVLRDTRDEARRLQRGEVAAAEGLVLTARKVDGRQRSGGGRAQWREHGRARRRRSRRRIGEPAVKGLHLDRRVPCRERRRPGRRGRPRLGLRARDAPATSSVGGSWDELVGWRWHAVVGGCAQRCTRDEET